MVKTHIGLSSVENRIQRTITAKTHIGKGVPEIKYTPNTSYLSGVNIGQKEETQSPYPIMSKLFKEMLEKALNKSTK